MDDFALLNKYLVSGDESAFTQLVKRYIGMVYGTALRRTGNRELAEEISQNVFSILAKKASVLKPGTILSGWLHRTAVLQAAHAMRTEQRRIKQMKEFSKTVLPESSFTIDQTNWGDVARLMDDSMNQLSDADRNVLFLRFSEQRKFREMGQLIGKSESATQRHTTRALEKLGNLLRKKGVVLPLASLALGLTSELGKAATAPAGLSATISKQALSSSLVTTTATSLFTTLTIMTTSLKTSTIILYGCALVALFTSGGILLRQLNQDDETDLSDGPLRESKTPSEKSTAHDIAAPQSITETSTYAEDGKNETKRLLDQAIKLAKETDDAKAAKTGIRNLLASLTAHEMAEGLKYLTASHQPDEACLIVTKELFRRWGSLDPVTAMELALKTGTPPEILGNTGAVAQSWAEEDPKAALAWYTKMKTSHHDTLGSGGLQKMIADIAEGTIRNDVETGFAMIESLDFDEQTAARLSINNFAVDETLRGDVSERIVRISDENLKIQVVDGFGGIWAKSNAKAATEWFDQIEFETPAAAFKAAEGIGLEYFEQDPRGAVDWFYPRVSDEMRMNFVRGMVGHGWAKRDREAAVRWLKEHNYDPNEIIK